MKKKNVYIYSGPILDWNGDMIEELYTVEIHAYSPLQAKRIMREEYNLIHGYCITDMRFQFTGELQLKYNTFEREDVYEWK